MSEDRPHRPPNGDAWKEAQRVVAERNDEARKAGRAERDAHERDVIAFKRADRATRGQIFR